MKYGGARFFLATSLTAVAAQAGETTTYIYDGRGRLIGTSSTGQVNNGVVTTIGYDAAGNRSSYGVAGVGAPPAPPPGPPPPPSPPSSPPPGPPPVFSVSGGPANEGSAIVFTVARSNLTAGTFSVAYATSNGSAAAYSDYQPASGTLTFTSEVSKTVTVTTKVDNIAEADETLVMTLSNPTGGATLHPTSWQAAGTINANAANNPPTAVLDTVSIARCTAGSFNVISNDTDPEGHIPLRLTAVGGGPVQLGLVSVGGTTDVAWAKASQPGLYLVEYTVKDSLNAASTGSLQVTVTGTGSGSCP